MDMDRRSLFDKIEESKEIKETKTRGRKSGGVIKYEYSNEDSDLMTLTKNLINENNITYQDVYNAYGKTKGYNMIGSIRKGQISWDRFKKWADIIDYEVSIVVKKRNK